MNYPFSKKTSLHRMVSLTLVLLLTLSMLSGCSLLPARQTTAATEPSTEDTQPSSTSGLIDEPVTTEAPTTEATVPPTTEVKKENVAVVKEQLSLRASPSTGSRVITQLDAGEEVEVSRIDSIGTVSWAYVSCDSLNVLGWVVTDMLDMSNVQLAANGTDTPGSGNGPTVPTNAPTTAPATTPTVDPITGTGNNNSTAANGKMGVVTANDLNIRDAASQSGNRVGSYNYGARVAIQETNNGWGRTDKGWISLTYVYMDGDTGTNTASGTVTASQLNVRSGPGGTYEKVSALNQGARVQILEQVKVGAETWGYTNGGWVSMQYIAVDGAANNNMGNTPTTNTPTAGTGTATVTGSGLNVRNGAGTGYNIVGALNQGDVVTILETTTADGMQWGRISQGWICMNYVRMN